MTAERVCPNCGYVTRLGLTEAPFCPRCGSEWEMPVLEAVARPVLVGSEGLEASVSDRETDIAVELEPESSVGSGADSVGEFFKKLSAQQEPFEESDGPEFVVRADSTAGESIVLFRRDRDEPVAASESPEPLASATERMRRQRQQRSGNLSWIAVAAIYLCGAMTGFVVGRLVYGPAAQSPLRKIPDYGIRRGGREWVVPDPSAAVPSGHWLRLGKAKRIGDLEIKPLRLFIDQVRFTTLNPHSGQTVVTESGEKTLFLAVEIRNLSDKMAFSPLDELFLRPNDFPAYAYIELPTGEHVGMYPLTKFSERTIQNQSFEELPPGQKREYWIAADPSVLKKLKDTMVWRLHLRVGGTIDNTYTSVVALKFSEEEIEAEG